MNNSELSIVFDKKVKKKNIPLTSQKFRPIKNEKKYYKEFAKEYLTIWNVLLILSALTFNRNQEYLWTKLTVALILIATKKSRYKSWLSYTITSILTWKLFVTIDWYAYAAVYLFSYGFFIIIQMALLVVFDLYCDLLLSIIQKKIMDRFPLNKEKLECCGVHDRFECLLYYHYMMHGFGKFKDPVINFDDIEHETIENLRNVFYEFPTTAYTKRKIEEAVEKEMLSEEHMDIILNDMPPFNCWVSKSTRLKDFVKVLSKSKTLYNNERNLGMYM